MGFGSITHVFRKPARWVGGGLKRIPGIKSIKTIARLPKMRLPSVPLRGISKGFINTGSTVVKRAPGMFGTIVKRAPGVIKPIAGGVGNIAKGGGKILKPIVDRGSRFADNQLKGFERLTNFATSPFGMISMVVVAVIVLVIIK